MRVARRPAAPATLPPAVVAAIGLLAAFIAGAAIAIGLSKGLAVLLGLMYLPVALTNLPLAIALWVPLVFLSRLGVVGVAPTAAALLIGFAWLGTLRRRGSGAVPLFRLHARRLAALALFMVWITLSISWAREPSQGTQDLWQWGLVGGAFLVLVTAMSGPEDVRRVALACVAGAVLSVVVSYFLADLTSSQTALQTAADERSRLGGVSGDPNYLAAGLVPAIVLASGLARRRTPLLNVALVAAVVVLTLGVVATESRGGLVAAAVALVASFLLFRGRRTYVVLFATMLVAVAAAWFSVSPDAWHRITTFNEGGNGRSDLWRVGLRMTEDHPVVGVGLNNFRVESPRYVRRPGALKAVALIADRPHVAHNTYLQFLAETGVVGLALFLAVLAGCLRAAWLAGRRFERSGERDLAALARAVLVAGIAAAAASFFISNGGDLRLWVLLALGPALLGVASGMAGAPAPSAVDADAPRALALAPSGRGTGLPG